MADQGKGKKERNILVAVIGGICTIAAAAAAALVTSHGHSPAAAPPGGAATVTPAVEKTTSGQTGSRDSAQPGYTLLWHQQVTIGGLGVVFQPNGPQQSSSSQDPELYYATRPGFVMGWYLGEAASDGTNIYYLESGSPSPSACTSATTDQSAIEQTARLGSQYCLVSLPMIVYMKVTALSLNNTAVTVDAIAWNKNT
jgi:hypothetical protein